MPDGPYRPTRRAVLAGGISSAALLLGCGVSSPPVRGQGVIHGRSPLTAGIAREIDRVEGVFRAALRAAFQSKDDEELWAWIASRPVADRAVCWEAGCMAIVYLEHNTQAGRSWAAAHLGAGETHAASAALGLGWGLSWLDLPPEAEMGALPPLVRWKVVDGYGFRDGMVFPRRYVVSARKPGGIDGYARTVWRQGLGRSLWYTSRADLGELTRVVAAFPAGGHADLWQGIGVAATWIGCVDEEPMRRLKVAAGPHARWLALGCALSARTARDAGGGLERQRAPCRVLCSASPEELAALTDEVEAALPPESAGQSSFQLWGEGVAARLG